MLHGDENFHFATLTDGSIVTEGADGYFYYATVSGEGIRSTGTKVGMSMPAATVNYYTSPDALQQLQALYRRGQLRRSLPNRTKNVSPAAGLAPIQNAERGLVILVSFTDQQFKYSNEDFSRLLNEEGYSQHGATGSALDYFEDVSYGQYKPTFDVFGPYELPHPTSYYGQNEGNDGGDLRVPEMIVDACKMASEDGHDLSIYDYNDDSIIDNVYVFYAGEGEANGGAKTTVWPHRWVVLPGYNYDGSWQDVMFNGVMVHDYACSNEICESYINTEVQSDMEGVGTFIHEFGHVLGLPDMYNTADNGITVTITPEIYDIMASGSYNHYSRTPSSYSAYERMYCGWLEPVQIYPDETAQHFTLPVIETGSAYIITPDNTEHNLDGINPNPAEFYLLENKSGEGWDTYLNFTNTTTPGDKGMLITRISYDERVWQSNTVNNNPNDMGIEYVYDLSQYNIMFNRLLSFYPMFPGLREKTSIYFDGIYVYNIERNDVDGSISFDITTSEATASARIPASSQALAVGGLGEITVTGNPDHVAVYTIQGVNIYNGSGDTRIDAAPGLYLVSLTQNGSTRTVKILVR